MKQIQLLENLQECLAFQHLANRTVASAYGTELGLVESTLMAEILGNPNIKAAELAKRTLLSRVDVCRALARCEALGFLTREKSSRDQRSQQIFFTPEGRAIFFRAYQQAQRTFGDAYARLPKAERQHFEKLSLRFCDDLASPPVVALPDDPPLMRSIRRLTRGLGLLSKQMFWFKELSPLEWHILRLCTNASCRAQDLAEIIGAKISTVAGALTRLEKRKLIKRTPDNQDRRQRWLSLSPAGIEILSRSRDCAVRLLDRGTKSFSTSELEDFIRLWEYYSGKRTAEGVFSFAPDLLCRLGETETARLAARTFIYRLRVDQGLLAELPSDLAAPQNRLVLLYQREQLVGLIESSGSQTVHALVEPKLLNSDALCRFLEVARELLGGNLILAEKHTSPELWRVYGLFRI